MFEGGNSKMKLEGKQKAYRKNIHLNKNLYINIKIYT